MKKQKNSESLLCVLVFPGRLHWPGWTVDTWPFIPRNKKKYSLHKKIITWAYISLFFYLLSSNLFTSWGGIFFPLSSTAELEMHETVFVPMLGRDTIQARGTPSASRQLPFVQFPSTWDGGKGALPVAILQEDVCSFWKWLKAAWGAENHSKKQLTFFYTHISSATSVNLIQAYLPLRPIFSVSIECFSYFFFLIGEVSILFFKKG